MPVEPVAQRDQQFHALSGRHSMVPPVRDPRVWPLPAENWLKLPSEGSAGG